MDLEDTKIKVDVENLPISFIELLPNGQIWITYEVTRNWIVNRCYKVTEDFAVKGIEELK